MTKQDYCREITVELPAKEVFNRINRVDAWWSKSFTGDAKTKGGAFGVRWGETFVDFKIEEMIPDRKIIWRVVDSNIHWLKDKKEWDNTRVQFDLLTHNGVTTVTMTHHGLTPEVECFEECEKGWDFFVGKSLRRYLVEGKGRPDREEI